MQSKRRNASNKRPKTLKILAVVAGLTVLTASSIVSAQLTGILEDVLISSVTASTGGGTGTATLRLRPGQLFAVHVDPNNLWSAGALPRWSNADGLVGPTFATGTDESGELAGTQIGADFGLLTHSA